MATLPQLTLDFNRQIKLSNDGGSLSSDTGEFIYREFDEKIGFSRTIAEYLHVKDTRKYYVHSNENLLRQKIYQLTAGYAEDDSADELTEDPVLTKIIGTMNEVKMMLSLLACNLTNWLRTLCFPKRKQSMQIETIRTRVIKVASKLVKSGRSFYFKLSSSFVYQKFFWEVLQRVQKLQLE